MPVGQSSVHVMLLSNCEVQENRQVEGHVGRMRSVQFAVLQCLLRATNLVVKPDSEG